MSFEANTYRVAAEEHVTVANRLYDMNRFVLAAYVAGLAVECILRAYRYRINPQFDARHSLNLLYKAARFAEFIPAGKQVEISAALGDVVTRWSNDHRYRSEAALRSFFKRANLHRGIKGDFVKENTRRIVNAATTIVILGVSRWNVSFKD